MTLREALGWQFSCFTSELAYQLAHFTQPWNSVVITTPFK